MLTWSYFDLIMKDCNFCVNLQNNLAYFKENYTIIMPSVIFKETFSSY